MTWWSRRRNSQNKTAIRRAREAVVEAVEARQFLSISAKFINVPISAAAKAADPTLNDLRTVDVQLTVTSGDDWLASDMLLRLNTGSFYNPKAGGNGPQVQAVWNLRPELEFDTFVSGPNFSSPTILGRREGSGEAIFSPSEVNVAWGDLVSTGAGTFTVARLTMTNNATGTLTGSLFANSNAGNAQPFAAEIKAISPPTPPPSTGAITGYVYNDQDANGGKGDTEPKLSTWQAYIDANNNGKLNTGEYSVRTRSSGNFTFSDLAPGTYRVRITLKDGWRRTAPQNTSFSFNVTVTAGGTAINKKFGVTQQGVSQTRTAATIRGSVMESTDRAVTEKDLEPLSGWRVYIDRDDDGRFDAGETFIRTDFNGNYSFADLDAGTYHLRLTQVEGYEPIAPSNNLIAVTVTGGEVSENHVFMQFAV